MNAVVKKIETILRSSYDTKNYVDLIREIFPKVSIRYQNDVPDGSFSTQFEV